MVHMPPCPICEGKRPFCIHKSYPLPRDFDLQKKISEKLSREFFVPSYSVFVGHNNYPNLNVGPMSGFEVNPALDDPAKWFGLRYEKIIELRSMLIRSKHRENVFSKSKFIQEQQELAIAKKPTDTEIIFKKTPVYHFILSESVQPMGPTGLLEKMKITENVKVDVRVEKIVGDDTLANEACYLLYSKGQDVYKISTILSSGILGLRNNKKLVPSRWTTTASHDIISKYLIEKIKQFPSANEYRIYSSQFLDNHFEVLLIPGNWEFENFETWAPGSNWNAQTQSKSKPPAGFDASSNQSKYIPQIIPEYEPYEGRTAYAESQAGGYYASRLGVTEGLISLKRQARVVVFREVYEGYCIPVGCWQILENVRNAFRQPCVKFGTKREAIDYVSEKLRIPISQYIKKSKILGQKKLLEF